MQIVCIFLQCSQSFASDRYHVEQVDVDYQSKLRSHTEEIQKAYESLQVILVKVLRFRNTLYNVAITTTDESAKLVAESLSKRLEESADKLEAAADETQWNLEHDFATNMERSTIVAQLMADGVNGLQEILSDTSKFASLKVEIPDIESEMDELSDLLQKMHTKMLEMTQIFFSGLMGMLGGLSNFLSDSNGMLSGMF